MPTDLTPEELGMLTSEEREVYAYLETIEFPERFFDEYEKSTFESLARTRLALKQAGEMMEKHEWDVYDFKDIDENGTPETIDVYCRECRNHKDNGHKPDCALAALLAKIESVKGGK
jgi:hypothetical protein